MDEYNKQMKAFTVLLRAAQSVQEVARKDVATYGMNMTEFAVLELLYHKGDQPIQIIGKKVLIASSSITYVVDKLEQKGYVKRNASPDDRRVTYACITESGKQCIQEVYPNHEQNMSKIFENFSEEQLATVTDLLKQIGKKAQSL